MHQYRLVLHTLHNWRNGKTTGESSFPPPLFVCVNGAVSVRSTVVIMGRSRSRSRSPEQRGYARGTLPNPSPICPTPCLCSSAPCNVVVSFLKQDVAGFANIIVLLSFHIFLFLSGRRCSPIRQCACVRNSNDVTH